VLFLTSRAGKAEGKRGKRGGREPTPPFGKEDTFLTVAHRYRSYVHTLSIDSNRAQAITETRFTTLMEGVAYRIEERSRTIVVPLKYC